MQKKTDLIDRLMKWRADQCNGDWEHIYGIDISTLDNPGWYLQIELEETCLEGKQFVEVSNLEPDNEWYRCWVESKCFHAAGGPFMLSKMLEIFLDWADSMSNSAASTTMPLQ